MMYYVVDCGWSVPGPVYRNGPFLEMSEAGKLVIELARHPNMIPPIKISLVELDLREVPRKV